MLTEERKEKIVGYLLRGLVPPGVLYYQCKMRGDFSYLIHVIMVDGQGIYAVLDATDIIHLIDPWDWLSFGGLEVLAHDHNIKSAEVGQDER